MESIYKGAGKLAPWAKDTLTAVGILEVQFFNLPQYVQSGMAALMMATVELQEEIQDLENYDPTPIKIDGNK